MSRFKEYMEIIQEMASENKGIDDMYEVFKKELVYNYLTEKLH